ncbi:CHAT domain-containing protein [Okeania sp.]|uniref:CHAT domain-containing protein n=1 Tax=Okeania sp. TaxID=3100323 RepID=UPI002B4ABD25|nr:CHAT domain-containing protein [Okeania sp.]MEB3343763.1 CHAT domain-containing protein [Okeania sp.]
MKLLKLHLYPLMALTSLLGTVAIPAHSQSITPATDGTGTTVNQNGNQFNIEGGSPSNDGANLFHSFGEFNVKSNQTANFLTTPDIQNILGRVTGGNASTINGLIQVIGGNSNLFLMNPAGIMFGPNASLNVPASFSVTTATGIGFDNNNFWFQTLGTNNYSNLVGNPSGYRFDVSNPGAIVNQGNLTLNPGNNLTLTGGTVVNTGELSTAGGNITIAAVNGGDVLRISQPGHVLSLDISPAAVNLLGESITLLSLPQLLTGSPLSKGGQGGYSASSVMVDAEGNLVLTDTTVQQWDHLAPVVISGNIDVSHIPPFQRGEPVPPFQRGEPVPPFQRGVRGDITQKGGQINILGSQIAIIDANINANGLNGGGNILIGGDFQGNGIVPNSLQTFVNNNSFISANAINNGNGGRVIIWSDNTTNFSGNISAKGGEFFGNGGFVEVSGKERLIFDGNVNVSAALGEGGTILFDPKNIIIGAETSLSLKGESGEFQTFSAEKIGELEGNISLEADNDITVNQSIETSESLESIELKAGRNINLNADINTSSGNGDITLLGNDDGVDINGREPGAASINQKAGTTLDAGSGNITIELGNLGDNGDINLAGLITTGQVFLNANQGNINQVSLNSLITADQAIFQTQDIGGVGLAEAPLRIDVNNLEVLAGEKGVFINSINNLIIGEVSDDFAGIKVRGGGNLELNINGNFTAIEEITTSVPNGQPGNINIFSSGNINTTETTLKANSISTSGGNIFLDANGNIRTGDINASTQGNNKGGDITINSGGKVNTTAGAIFSASLQGNGGDVTITSDNNLTTGYIDSRSNGGGNGGNITLESTGGNVNTSRDEIVSFSVGGNAGNVTITSEGDITTADIFSSAGEALDQQGDLGNSSPFDDSDVSFDQPQTADGNGGNITLTAEGNIDTRAGTLESFSRLGGAGRVSITSKGDITTGGVFSSAGNPIVGNVGNTDTTETAENTITNNKNGGDIIIESKEGKVTLTKEIDTVAVGGNAGNVSIKAARNINTETIESATSGGNGGDVTIESTNGSIDTTGVAGDAQISSLSLDGTAGNVTVKSDGSLIAGNINSSSENVQGGNITLESKTGNVDTSNGELISSSLTGNAGNISITSDGNITTGNISSFAGQELGAAIDSDFTGTGNFGNGGNITLTAGGDIDTTAGTESESSLTSFSRNGSGGNISLEATGDIVTNVIISTAGDPENNNPTSTTENQSNSANGGDINIKSTAGAVTTTGEINSFASSGNGGNITIEAVRDINIGDNETKALANIDSRSDNIGQGGNIIIESTEGAVTINSEIESFGATSKGGNITIKGHGDIEILNNQTEEETATINSRANTNSDGGDIFIKSNTGAITIDSELSSSSGSGDGGNINIQSSGNLTTSNIDSRSKGDGKGGDITLESQNQNVNTSRGELSSFSELGNAGSVKITSSGNLTTGSIDSRANSSGQGGNITLESMNGNIDTSSGFLSSFSGLRNAGHINITSNLDITTGNIDSRSDDNGNGGNIALQSTKGNIDTSNGDLISSSFNGNAGSVSITATQGNIQANNISSFAGAEFEDQEESSSVIASDSEAISNNESGMGNGGDITLRAGGTIEIERGNLESFSRQSNGGNINIEAEGNITTAKLLSTAGNPEEPISPTQTNGGRSGDITVTSAEGSVTIQKEINSLADLNDGGNVTIKSHSDIIIEDEINTRSDRYGKGGDIEIESTTGGIEIGKKISSRAEDGSGGAITLNSQENIQTQEIESFSRKGAAGNIEITATGDISTSEILSSAGDPEDRSSFRNKEADLTITQSQVEDVEENPGGNITIQSREGTVTSTGEIVSYSQNGNAGNVTIISKGDINLADIDSRSDFSGTVGTGNGGEIFIKSETGAINTTNGELASSSRKGNGGNVNIIGADNIEVENISSFSESNGNGGNVNIASGSDVTTATISSSAESNGQGGNIFISADGAIDTSIGELSSFSTAGQGGNITLSATTNISTGFIESFSGGGTRGGDITLDTINGNIDTTAGLLNGEANISTNADVSSENIATIFAEEPANLSSYAPEGSGGNIFIIQRGEGNITTSNISSFGGENSGTVNIINNNGNINTEVIFSTGINRAGGFISLQTQENGNLNINHIATYSSGANGTGGDINLDASGIVNINNVASFGNAGSGNVNIQSISGSINTGTIQTRAPNGTSGNIALNTFSTQGDIRTANVTTQGGTAAGKVEIIAADGSVTTQDLESSSESGTAGGIEVQAGENIETGDQTVDSGTGDANITNIADGNITTGDQTAITENGDANIANIADQNITTGDQTAITENGDANITNIADRNITTGDQTAITENGDANITNIADRNITTGDQTAITENGDANITNIADRNITTGDITPIGNIRDIINLLADSLNTGEIISINPSIDNTLLEALPQIPVTLPNLEEPPTPITNGALNSIATKIIQSVQNNSSIRTTNNPNPLNKKSDRQTNNINPNLPTHININTVNTTPLTVAASSQTIINIEQNRTNEFADYFQSDLYNQTISTQNIREVLTKIASQTGNNSAIIYITAYPDSLQLVLYTPGSDPILKTIPQINRKELMETVLNLRAEITNPLRRDSHSYLPPAQKLYKWLIAPIAAELETAKINTLLFSMDNGLRTLPMAALHDGEQFLIEKYSLSLIPSISLMDTNYRPLQNTQILAMGASQFIDKNPLPAVPTELETISQEIWQGNKFLNQEFTRDNLLGQRQNYPYPIIHLATHAEFRPGKANNSYIQLWGTEQLKLDQIRELGWNEPAVELLVLSACRTAFGDKDAELGFAGLAVAAGVKSALASIWYVSDEGTLALMTEFYTHLNRTKIKAEALRQAQLSMLRGEVVIADGELRGTGVRGVVVLPSGLGQFENKNLSHPYYWSGFTMVGSPW